MPEVEDALHDFARRHPGFEILRLFGSTSKAENVNRAVRHVRGAVIGVFDADHWPAPDSFRRAVQWIIDGRMDVVQGRCVVRNGGQSLMSKLVAVEFEQIYGVAHPGRARMHGFGIFGGTNGFWRTSVLRTVKFDESMLTEDIDSGLRALRAGHRLHSDPYLVSYELATATLASFWSQRMRWAQGWFQASLRHTLPLATDRRLTKRQRAGAVHLFFWREVYPWLALQMWPIIFFWVHRYGLFRIDWTVLPWIALTFINLLTGPVLILFAWYSAHPSVRKEWRWFALSMLLAPFFSELKNGLCRVAQFKQLRGGKHEWVVTPRDVAPAARPAGS
jgi:cellulose synthase/poly-beta-1,6-N-acetylglucosamine synthase-like glycosyltransferase